MKCGTLVDLPYLVCVNNTGTPSGMYMYKFGPETKGNSIDEKGDGKHPVDHLCGHCRWISLVKERATAGVNKEI